MLKKYWKIAAAVAFFIVAGFCYAAFGPGGEAERLPERGPTAANGPSEAGSEAEETAECYVHVCGEVRAPGVYLLPEGSRIFEAVEAAGGFTEEASESSLNLAAVIADGMKITVPGQEEVRNRSENGGSGGLVNLNTSAKDELMTLPGIGASRADDIIRYRERSGGFGSVEEIMNIPGIKNAVFEKIKDRITV